MKGMIWYAIAIVILLFIAGALIYPKLSLSPEWKHYQREYRKVMEEVYHKPVEISEGIKEIGSLKIGRKDRCITCHLGVDEPLLEGTLLQNPFGPHPTMYHSLQEFGCTICHLGDGSALTAEKAHNNPKFPQSRMIPTHFTEASCGKCHRTKVVNDAWDLTEGRRLIKTNGCMGCHWIPGYPSYEKTGYDLTGLGSKVNRAWLEKWLHNPRQHSSSSIMPSFKLSESEISLLSDFLLSSRNYNIDEIVREIRNSAQHIPRQSAIENGRQQIEKRECDSCHAFDGKGGRIAPDLGKIGSKVNKDWLLAWLKYPDKFFPETLMPRYSFPDGDIESIVEYLMTHMLDASLLQQETEQKKKRFNRISEKNIQKGKKLFVQYGCYGCHLLEGIENLKKGIGPALGGIGSKNVADLDFGKSEIPRTLTDYVYYKLKKPDVFSDTLFMPHYHLSDTEARQMTLALLSSMSSESIPDRLIIREEPERVYKPIGEFGKIIQQYQCLDCHQIHNSGNPIGPDLSKMGSKLKRDWLISYMAMPYPIRPLVIEKMPVFSLTKRELETLADYAEENLTDDTIPEDLFSDSKPSKALIKVGKDLFYEEYGCHACHIIGDEGGIYGPSLNNAGNRLKPDWVYALLNDPQAMDPTSIIPDFGIPPEYAKALTAYITNLKAGDDSVTSSFHQVPVPEENPIPDRIKGVRRYQATKGKNIYFRYCVFCHGADGSGDGSNAVSLQIAPHDFTDITFMANVSNEYLYTAIHDGGTAIGKSVQMPPYGRTLTDMEIRQVVTYIRTYLPIIEVFRYKQLQKQE